MNRFVKLSVIAAAVAMTAACTRIETGEVGLRRGFDKQVSNTELLPGSFNQTIIGEVMTFPIKDVNVKLDDLTPLAKDNSTMKDFDAVVIYNLNQSQVAELYNTKSKAFHVEHKGDTYLMYNYVMQMARNAIYKAARDYDALEMADNRAAIEVKVKELMQKSLAEEKIDGAVAISQVLVRNVQPVDSVVASANELVRAKNELKQKEVEVKTAEAEARRIAALNANAGAIQYMDAQARMMQAEAAKITAQSIANFKGSTLVLNGQTPVLNVGK